MIKPEEFFKGDSIKIDVFKAKYPESENSGVDDCFEKTANEAVSVSIEKDKEKWSKRWKQEMLDDIWRPGGSIISATNKPDKKVSVFNCMTCPIENDNLESIYKARTDVAKAAAYRQGVGVDFSNLRPAGTTINNSAEESEGAVHWIKSFGNISKEVGQKGRQPALLSSLKINHPDIEEFVVCKSNVKELESMNISVQVLNSFMNSYKKDQEWDLYFITENGEKIQKKIKAKKLFKDICKNAWANGEPGIQYIELMKNHSLQESLGYSIISSNACCLYGKTLVKTLEFGEQYLEDLEEKRFHIYDGEKFVKCDGVVKQQDRKDLYLLDTIKGNSLVATNDHKIKVKNGQLKKLYDLSIGDKIKTDNYIVDEVKDVSIFKRNAVVYDIINSESGVFVADNFIVSNSEKPLPAYGVCCLSSINMNNVPGIRDQNFHEWMEKHVYSIVRFMDNIVQYEIENKHKSPLKEQYEIVKDLREIGLGITNLHKWLYNQGAQYDDSEGIALTESFFKWYAHYAFLSSCKLALERGACPAWIKTTENKSKEDLKHLENEYLKGMFKEFPNLEELYYDIGIRNGALLSIAPTGSISMTFSDDIISSGIEPLIGYFYWRKTRAIKKGEWDYYFIIPNSIKNIILENIGDKNLEDYKTIEKFSGSVLDNDGEIGKKLIKIIEKHVKTDLLKPAHKIDPFQKVKMMGKIQKWVDAAISVTYNVPKTFSVEDVEKLYEMAYDHKLKAITVYRDGSREEILTFTPPNQKNEEGVPENLKYRPSEISYTYAPKRPKKIPFESHIVLKHKVIVGLYDDKPFECFIIEPKIKIPKEGFIVKNGKRKYCLTDKDNNVILENMLDNEVTNDEIKAITRLVSSNIRHGVPIDFVVEQLSKCGDSISAYPKMLGRVLKKYKFLVADEIKSSEKCPNCESILIKYDGCSQCSCGYSKCS